MRLEDIIEESHDKALFVAVTALLVLSITIVSLGFLYSAGQTPTGQLVDSQSIDPLFNETNETTDNETDQDPNNGTENSTINNTSNTPPNLTRIPDQNISDAEQFEAINTSLYVKDNETSTEELNWSFGGNEHINISIEREHFLVPRREEANWSGSETINITVTDEGGLNDSANTTFSVYENHPPQIRNISNMTLPEGDNVSLALNVSDPNGDNITINYSSPLNASGEWSIPENYTENITYKTVNISATDTLNASRSRLIRITIVDTDAPELLNLSIEVGQQHANFSARFDEECAFVFYHRKEGERYNINKSYVDTTTSGNNNPELSRFIVESWRSWNDSIESFRRNLTESDAVIDTHHHVTVRNLSRDTTYYYTPLGQDLYMNLNAANGSSYTTEERPIEPPLIDTFNGSTTDFSLLPPGQNLTCVDQPVFEKSRRGKMEILEDCVSVASLNLDEHLTIGHGELSLNGSAAQEINKRSRISLYDINLSNPGLLCDGNVCNESRYTFIRYENGTYVFTTENVSDFSVVEQLQFDSESNTENNTIATEDTLRLDTTLKHYGSPLGDDYCSISILNSSYNISIFEGDHHCEGNSTEQDNDANSTEDNSSQTNSSDGQCSPTYPVSSQMDYDNGKYQYSLTFADHVNLTNTGSLSYRISCNLTDKGKGFKNSSGEVEVIYEQYCGNGICDTNESCENCSDDCGLCPCEWEYPSWEEVPCVEGKKVRNVTHGPNCREVSPKPNETKACGVALCDNGELDPMEEDVDCGGPCEPCETCNDSIQNQGEEGVDCGGPCEPCPTCDDDIKNQGEEGVDCGGPCEPCPTCDDDIQNQGEEGVDCGGPCEPCDEKKQPNTEEPASGNNPLIIGLFSTIIILMLGGMGAFIYLKKDALFGPQEKGPGHAATIPRMPPQSGQGPNSGQQEPARTAPQRQQPPSQQAEPALVQYIKKQRLRNVGTQALRKTLSQKGWSKQQVELAMKQAQEEIRQRYAAQIAQTLTRFDLSNPHVVTKIMQSSRYPKDIVRTAIEQVLEKRYPPHVRKRIEPYLQ